MGRKSLAAPGNRTCVSGMTVRCSNQLSYIPSHPIIVVKRSKTQYVFLLTVRHTHWFVSIFPMATVSISVHVYKVRCFEIRDSSLLALFYSVIHLETCKSACFKYSHYLRESQCLFYEIKALGARIHGYGRRDETRQLDTVLMWLMRNL